MIESDARSRIFTDRQIEESRFWSKVKFGPVCWEWIGSIDNNGYGAFRRRGNGGTNKAHRVAVEFDDRVIPDGLVVDHLCRNRICVRPDHLEVTTLHANSSRGNRPIRIHQQEQTK